MKKNTKAAGIMKLLKQGYTPTQIKERMAVSESYIHAVKKLMKAGVEAKVETKVETPKPGEFIQTSTNNVDAILNERGSRYGNFLDHATITYQLKELAHGFARARGKNFAYDQCEALDMIFHKIGRILNGDPNYADSWIDIAGYAQLVADRLEGKIR